jgi:hypothetical protein
VTPVAAPSPRAASLTDESRLYPDVGKSFLDHMTVKHSAEDGEAFEKALAKLRGRSSQSHLYILRYLIG